MIDDELADFESVLRQRLAEALAGESKLHYTEATLERLREIVQRTIEEHPGLPRPTGQDAAWARSHGYSVPEGTPDDAEMWSYGLIPTVPNMDEVSYADRAMRRLNLSLVFDRPFFRGKK